MIMPMIDAYSWLQNLAEDLDCRSESLHDEAVADSIDLQYGRDPTPETTTPPWGPRSTPWLAQLSYSLTSSIAQRLQLTTHG